MTEKLGAEKLCNLTAPHCLSHYEIRQGLILNELVAVKAFVLCRQLPSIIVLSSPQRFYSFLFSQTRIIKWQNKK